MILQQDLTLNLPFKEEDKYQDNNCQLVDVIDLGDKYCFR
jgi:hypothetical protein